MENFISKMLKSSIWGSIALIVLGILLVFKSELTIVSISYIIGSILIAMGVIALIKYINGLNKNAKNELDIVYGIGTIILGVIVICNPKAIASIIPFVLGIIIIINSAAKLDYSFKLKKIGSGLWTSTLIISLITLVIGVFLVFNPFAGAEFITRVIGIILFIYGILDIISTARIIKIVKKTTPTHKEKNKIEDNQKEENIVEAEVIEDNTKENKKKTKKATKDE